MVSARALYRENFTRSLFSLLPFLSLSTIILVHSSFSLYLPILS